MAGLLDIIGLGNYAGAGSGGLLDSLRGSSGTLTGLGAGLLSGNNWQSGLANGIQAAGMGKEADRKRQLDEAKRIAVQKYATGTDLSETEKALVASDPEIAEKLMLAEHGAGGPGGMGLQPQGYWGADGKFHYAQLSKKGGATDLAAPGGGTWAQPYTYQNAGTQFVPTSKYGPGPQGGGADPNAPRPIPIDNAGKAEQTDLGQAAASNKITYNSAVTKMDQLDASIDGLANDPRLDKSVGGAAQFDPMHPIESANRAYGGVSGSDAYDYRAKLKETVSKQFGAAIPAMKGLGSLSNTEGSKVEAALGNLDPNMSPEEFRAALGRVKETMRGLRAAMEQDARGGMGPQGAAPPTQSTAAPGGQPDLVYVPGKGLVPAGAQ